MCHTIKLLILLTCHLRIQLHNLFVQIQLLENVISRGNISVSRFYIVM